MNEKIKSEVFEEDIHDLVKFFNDKKILPLDSLLHTATFIFYTMRLLKFTVEEKKAFFDALLSSDCMKE